MSPSSEAGTRIDAWTWAVRLYPSRTAATAACTAGHVKVNDVSVKPAHRVRIGDTVRAMTRGGPRIVLVTGLLSKRVGAAEAVQHYEDRTPPAPPAEERSTSGRREPGSGRPTKRERREVDRLHGRA